MVTKEQLKHMSLSGIAKVISNDWKNVYFGAVPYLQALATLETINDDFGLDSGREMVLYFLANASTWKGEVARMVKAELKSRAKIK